MKNCRKCIYYPKCEEFPFDESGCNDYIASSEFRKVKSARWINQSFSLNGGTVRVFSCSECGCEKRYAPNYCPNCGAKMDVKENE